MILLLLLPVTALAQDDNHDNHEGWTALTNEVLSGNTLPAGKYYLSDDLECNGTPQTWITITDEVTLCLNGHVLNLNGQSLRVQSGATLHLCDCNTTNQTHKFTVGSNGLWQLDEADGTETLTGGVITGGENRKEDISSWNGGGVFVNGTFAMSGGNIVGNMSTNKGGGVYVDINGTFTLSGGSIAGNTCTYSGGGVFVNGNGTFTMSGGSIAGNTCTYSGGGVYAYRTFTMSGAPIVTDNKKRDDSNSNIYLYSSITIGEGGLTEGAKLGVTPDGSKTVVYSWNDEWGNPAVYFTSDNSDYGVGLDDQGNVVLVQKGSVTLDSNGGTIAEGKEVTSYTFGTSVPLPTADDITREGYTFGGWYDNEDFSGEKIEEISATDTGDKKYWAKWTANSYTVGFNANGGAGTMTNQSFTYDVVQALSTNAFTRTGYTFTGWNTATDGTGTSYSDKQEVSNLSSAVGGEVTLYAQWTASSYTVTLNTNGGTIAEGKEVTSYTFGMGATLPTEVTRTGYTFDGWYAKEDFSGDKVTVIPADATGDKAYWAKWIANTYTITVQVADGCDGMGEVTGGGTYGYGETTTLTATAKSGYRFVKWEDGEAAATREITVTGDATYTALFEQVEKPKPDPISYYNIYVEDVCDGVKIIPSKQVVREGGSINVYVKKDTANYTFDNFHVYYKEGYYDSWDELKEGTQPGEYPIKNIWNHIYIKAEGAEEKEDPTGIESIEGVKVYTKDGSLYVQTPQREQVIIVSMSGAVVKNEEQIGLKQYHGLQPGIYIVRVGDRAYKVRLN